MTRKQAAKILGVAIDAPNKEVRKAYLTLAKKAHPDHGGTDQAMQQLVEARLVMEKSVLDYDDKYDFTTDPEYQPFEDETVYEDHTLKNLAWAVGICLVLMLPFKLATKQKEQVDAMVEYARAEQDKILLRDKMKKDTMTFSEIWNEVTHERFVKQQREVRSKIYDRR